MIIADQPIRISAPFLALNPSISDPVLLQVINRHGNPHARAVSRRSELSTKLVDVLLELNDAAVARSLRLRHGVETRVLAPGPEGLAHLRNDNALRHRIKDMALSRVHERVVLADGPVATSKPDHAQWGRLAQPTQRTRFKALLSRAMGAEEDLAERILLDDSGTQLAMALQSLNLPDAIILGAMVGLFPALREATEGVRHADAVLQSLDWSESKQRVAAWVRANRPMRTGRYTLHQRLNNNNSEKVRSPVSARSLQTQGRCETRPRLNRA